MAFVPAWKRFETWVGSMIHGRRYPANSGHKIDCEGPLFTAQCKLVKAMSLNELTELAARAHLEGRQVPAARGGPKIGLVAVKLSGHRGPVRSPALFILSEDSFREIDRLLIEADPSRAGDLEASA